MDHAIRRLAAIVAADIVGYSRKIEADEASTLAALRDILSAVITPLLAENHGRMIKTMGDGFIAEFGSVVDAVTFAVAMQKAVPERQAGTAAERRLVFRVGINLGDVVVEGEDLLGDGVNVAARLEQLSTPGGITISGTAYDQLQGKLGLPLDFTGEQKVKNITRPVRTYSVRLAGAAGPRWRGWKRALKRAWPAAAAVVVAAVFAGGLWRYLQRDALSARPSVAVLPFEDIGGDAVSHRLARGLMRDISNDLSRLREIDIVAVSSAETASDVVDPRQSAKNLNVRYLVSGAIQHEGEAVRVTAQLMDGRSGASLWSRRWDRPMADIFAVQNEVADGVIGTLGDRGLLVNLTAAAARRKTPSDLQAYDLYALGVAAKHKGTPESLEESLKYEEAAIAKDPQLAIAYAQTGWSLMWLGWNGQRNMAQSLTDALKLGREGVEIDPNDAEAHVGLGSFLFWSGDNAGARKEIDRALDLSPSSADVLMLSAKVMSYVGEPERGAAMCDRGRRLNASPPRWYPSTCTESYFLTGRYRDSADANKSWMQYMPKTIWAGNFAWLAAAQIEDGAVADAAATIAEWKRLFPDLGSEVVLGYPPYINRQQDADKFLAALKKANAPICIAADKIAAFQGIKHLPECDAERAKQATR